MKVGNYWISIISHKRPDNVPLMKLFAPYATWYVKDRAEAAVYQERGAKAVGSGGLMDSRNRALADAFAQDLWCVQLSDDLRKMRLAVSTKAAISIELPEALAMVHEAMVATEAYLGGAAPTDNPFYTNANKPVSTNNFIVGDFMVIRPTPLQFDTRLRLKEDYDYTAQHLRRYGRVARCNHLLFTFQHATNPGGAVSYRTDELEQETIAYLKQKHGSWIVDNPKRKNQIILKPR
jgi:hypothetical protein